MFMSALESLSDCLNNTLYNNTFLKQNKIKPCNGNDAKNIKTIYSKYIN